MFRLPVAGWPFTAVKLPEATLLTVTLYVPAASPVKVTLVTWAVPVVALLRVKLALFLALATVAVVYLSLPSSMPHFSVIRFSRWNTPSFGSTV
ncbi:hypothetical protein D3C76_1546670 [compost metagenome]